MHMRLLSGCFVGVCALTLVNSSFAGPDWVEDGDAGSSLDSAQPVVLAGGGQVRRIIGTLMGAPGVAGDISPDYEDIYQIYISEPTKLLISTAEEYGGAANFQTSLWLFDAAGFAQLANVYSPQGPFGEGGSAGQILGSTLFNFATDDTGFVVSKPGVYYLAITGVPNHPLASGPTEGQDMFTFDQFDEISGPDGPAANFPFIKWWQGEGETGSYDIIVEGVTGLPAPGALALLGLGELTALRRRR